LKTGVWLADYYRLCQILLGALGKELGDLFTDEEAGAAETMIAAAAEALESEVKQYVFPRVHVRKDTLHAFCHRVLRAERRS